MKPKLEKFLMIIIPIFLGIYMLVGSFCRYYQLQYELLYDGGLIPGAFMHVILLILTVTFLLGMGFLLYGPKHFSNHKECFPKHWLPISAEILSGIVMVAWSFILLRSHQEPVGTYTAVSVALTKYLPYLGLISGVMVVLFAIMTYTGKTPTALLYMIVSLFLVVRLIVYFQTWNMDPSVHDYIYKLLAAICAMLGCFQIAGFSLGKGKRSLTAFWCLGAVFFTAVSLPDYLSFTYTDSSVSDMLVNIADLLINSSLLILSLTHGIQLLRAPSVSTDPLQAEETPATVS